MKLKLKTLSYCSRNIERSNHTRRTRMITETNYVPTIYIEMKPISVLDKEALRKYLFDKIDKMKFPRPDLADQTGKE